ncbi:MAG: TonB-dependent receptor [Ignavibacteriae bacterium]|nr:TonB-dependent receptor [Ignavibacteria bacterium]MBI3364181.1 TonB-dependent receptor [Ignavibacteriota bacterium]
MNSTLRFFVAFCLFLFLTVSLAVAGNTGKVIGRVTDKQSGEGLVSVNILVVGTTRGAVTDVDGRYTIIGIPIGTYTLRASQVGYQQMDITDVKIGADETTQLNFQLLASAVEITGVTVSADAQLVNSLATGSTQTVNAKAIESIPNVKSVEDVLRLQAGVVKQGNNLFLRGGRADEVQYLVDGIPTNSILPNTGSLTTAGANDELQKVYAGVQSGTVGGGATGLSVSANAIQSVSVQTSGFDADLGNAQSGVVNIVTKSGGDHYSASAQFRTDRVSPSNQNENYSSFSLGGPEPLTKYLFPSLGLNIPGTLTFFFNADADRADGPYNFVQNEFYHPIERRVELNGFLGGVLNGLGFRYHDDQKNNFTFNSKLKYDMSGSDQFSYGYRASLSSSHDYNNAWKFRADSSLLTAKLSIQHVFSWTHFFTQNSFMRIHLARVEQQDGNDVAGIKPSDYSSAYQKRDPNDDGFNELGTDQKWYKANTNVWTARFDFNSQVHPLHLIKTGLEFNYEEINSTEIVRPTVPLSFNGADAYPPYPPELGRNRGDYPGYGQFRWNLNNYPNRGAAYIQDNIEFSGLNLHIGLRYDYLDIGKQTYYQDYIDNWTDALNDPSTPDSLKLKPEWPSHISGGSTFKYYVLHGYMSPRLSIGYPVTDRIVFYFNYGHFLQFPDRDRYFRDPTILGATNNTIGNPDLKPQRTVSYEAGFEDQFSDDMAFAIHAFYKDIFDYADVFKRAGNNFYRNFDYGSGRGFELTFNQAFAGNFSASLSYTYQIAKGRSSNPLANLFQPQFELPRESRLDWDQNHTGNIFVTYRVSPKEPGTFFGLPFVNNYGISFTWSFGSGLPFTPTHGRETARTVYFHNGESKPYTSTVNLSLYKGFILMDRLNMLFTLDVTNLFNRRNVNNVNDASNPSLPNGDPAKYGDYDPGTGEIYPWYQTDSRLNPANFGDLRQIIFGLKLNWD